MHQLSSSAPEPDNESNSPLQVVPESVAPTAAPQPPSFRRKMMIGALAIGVLPAVLVGAIASANYQRLQEQVSQSSQVERTVIAQHQSSLYVGTGVVAVLAGAIAALLTYRTLQPLRTATEATQRLVQQLSRGTATTVPKGSRDDADTLEANLKFIAVQALKLRSQQALEINRVGTELPHLPDSIRTFAETSGSTAQDLSAAGFRQTKLVDATYSDLVEITNVAQEILTGLRQSIQQGQSVGQAAQVGQQTVEQIKEHHASMWVSLIEAATKVQNLTQPAQRLDQVLEHVSHITTDIKLKAMNAALEAARIGEMGAEFATIGEELHTLVRQLDEGIAEVDSILVELKTEVQETGAKMTLGQQQASSGKLLMVVAQQQLDQIVALSSQLEAVSEQALQRATQQTQLAATAGQTMVDVATLTSQMTEHSALLSDSIQQLPTLAQEE